jgi:hypothetical protein
MKVRLVRYTFPDRPDWEIIEQKVPLGTVYEVFGYDRNFFIVNEALQEVRPIDAYYLIGNNHRGWLPTVCFETVHEEN